MTHRRTTINKTTGKTTTVVVTRPKPARPEPVTHLVNTTGARVTACGLRDEYGGPAVPFVVARKKSEIDQFAKDADWPPVAWCPACLRFFGWPT